MNTKTSIAIIGFLAATAIGVLSPLRASALDATAITNFMSTHPSLNEVVRFMKSSPFDANCPTAQNGSTINCSPQNSSDSYYNTSDAYGVWGHGGKGVVFSDEDNLVDNNPQLAIAERGDKINFSMQLNVKRYLDDEESDPVMLCMAVAAVSDGLTINSSSAAVVSEEQTSLNEGDSVTTEDRYLMLVFRVSDTTNGNTTFHYPDNATIDVSYSADIAQNAPSAGYSNVAFTCYTKSMNSFSSGSVETQDSIFQAKALLDAALQIRRLDYNGEPVSGAKYKIDGIRAKQSDYGDNILVYDENGEIDEFTTNDEGRVVILGVPHGTYAVQELYAPNGRSPVEEKIITTTTSNLKKVSYGKPKYVLDGIFGASSTDVTNYIEDARFSDGPVYVSEQALINDPDYPAQEIYNYSSEHAKYFLADSVRTPSTPYIEKINGNYRFVDDKQYSAESLVKDFVYDESVGKSIATVTFDDIYSAVSNSFSVELTPEKAIVHDAPADSYTLHYDDASGDYVGTNMGSDYILRKTTTGYRLEEIQDGKPFSSNAYVPGDRNGVYIKDFPVVVRAIDEASDQSIITSRYYVIEYEPAFNHYYLSSGSNSQSVIQATTESAYVSDFLFRDADDAPAAPNPESLPANPQTADAIFRALLALAVAIIFGAVLAKHTGRGRLA